MTDWQPIATAPNDRRILLWTGTEMYVGHWAENFITGDRGWIIAEWGTDGDQAVLPIDRPTKWAERPEPPQEAI